MRLIALLGLLSCSAAIAQTTVAGFTPGSFRVTESGAAEYRIPIRVPPGIGGMEPKLALAYNSQAGNGLLGMGGSLEGLSSITRCPRTMAQDGVRGGINYDANDRYCLDGQRLMAIGPNSTEYRTERESFTKVIAYGETGNGPEWFKAWTKSGQIIEYGRTVDSRIEAQGKASVRAWAVNRISDAKGNSLAVSYTEDNANGDFRPLRIDYGGNSSVQFFYEARSDIVPAYQAGSIAKTMQRLSRVSIYAGTALSRDYRISYAATNEKSKIAEIRECDAAEACLAGTVLTYPPGASAALAGYTSMSTWSPSGGFVNASVYPLLSGDWNGDGRADWARVHHQGISFFVSTGEGFTQFVDVPGWSPGNGGFTNAGVYPLFTGDWNGDGRTDWARVHYSGITFFVATDSGFVPYTDVAGWGPGGGFVDGNVYPVITGDWNADGRMDWARVHSTGITFFVSTGGGFSVFAELPGWSPANGGFTNASVYPIFTGDWNGDGRTDWARVHYDGIRFFATTDAGFVQYAELSGWGYGNGFSDGSVYPIVTGDWNGDGKTDWARVQHAAMSFFVSTGAGFERSADVASWSPSGGFTDAHVFPLFTGDWNGDGRTDWGRVHCCGATFFTATPSGFASFAEIASLGPSQGGFTDGGVYPVLTGDWNGDGKTDFSRVQYEGMSFYKGGAFVPDSPTAFSPGAGAPIAVAYRALTDAAVYQKDAGADAAAYPRFDLQQPMYVVSSVASGNAVGGVIASEYRYGGLKASADGRGALGFRWQESTDLSSGLKTRTELRQDWPYVGLPSMTRRTQASGAVLSQTLNSYGSTNPAAGVYFPFVSQSVESGNDLSGAALPTVTTTSAHDPFGNPTSIAVSTSDGHSKTTTNTFTNDAATWRLGRLMRSTVLGTSP